MIIKSANELRDPFLTFCLFMRWMPEAGEDYLDYFCNITQPAPFVSYLQGKGYIKNETADDIFEDRKRVYKSVYSKPFYKDDNGVSLSCIIEDEQLECKPNVLSITIDSEYDLQELTYKELYTLAVSKTIAECDSFV